MNACQRRDHHPSYDVSANQVVMRIFITGSNVQSLVENVGRMSIVRYFFLIRCICIEIATTL